MKLGRAAPTSTLNDWQSAVNELSNRANQPHPPRVQWANSACTRYTRRTDTIGVSRQFARHWPATSPEARWLLAHELGHRAHPDVAARAQEAQLRSASARAVIVAGAIIGATLLVAQWALAKPGSVHTALAILSGGLLACAAVTATILVLRGMIVARTQSMLFGEEFAADDYATRLVGGAGCTVLTQLPEGRLFARWTPRTHPPSVERVERQQQ